MVWSEALCVIPIRYVPGTKLYALGGGDISQT